MRKSFVLFTSIALILFILYSADVFSAQEKGGVGHPGTQCSLIISSEDLDWSCYGQCGGSLLSEGLCVWQGAAALSDGYGTYLMAHNYTEYGEKIASLRVGDAVSIDSELYLVREVRNLWYPSVDYVASILMECKDNSFGDRAFFQTCLTGCDDGDIRIVETVSVHTLFPDEETV